MPVLRVPDDADTGGSISVAGTKDTNPEADVTTDAVDHARDLSVREDDDGRYVGVSSHYAEEVAEYLGVDAPTTDEDGGEGDSETEDGSADEETAGEDSDAQPDSGTCDAVKTDGEVCGRELPCPYHSDDEEGGS